MKTRFDPFKLLSSVFAMSAATHEQAARRTMPFSQSFSSVLNSPQVEADSSMVSAFIHGKAGLHREHVSLWLDSQMEV